MQPAIRRKTKKMDFLHFDNTQKGLGEMMTWLKHRGVKPSEMVICAQSRWDYVNVRGFGALTVALVVRLPGDYSPPCGRPGGHKPAQRAEQPTAGRDRFSFNCGESVSESVTDLLRHSLAAKSGIDGCLSGRLVRPRRASTALIKLSEWFADPITALLFHSDSDGSYRPSVFIPSLHIRSVLIQDVDDDFDLILRMDLG